MVDRSCFGRQSLVYLFVTSQSLLSNVLLRAQSVSVYPTPSYIDSTGSQQGRIPIPPSDPLHQNSCFRSPALTLGPKWTCNKSVPCDSCFQRGTSSIARGDRSGCCAWPNPLCPCMKLPMQYNAGYSSFQISSRAYILGNSYCPSPPLGLVCHASCLRFTSPTGAPGMVEGKSTTWEHRDHRSCTSQDPSQCGRGGQWIYIFDTAASSKDRRRGECLYLCRLPRATYRRRDLLLSSSCLTPLFQGERLSQVISGSTRERGVMHKARSRRVSARAPGGTKG